MKPKRCPVDGLPVDGSDGRPVHTRVGEVWVHRRHDPDLVARVVACVVEDRAEWFKTLRKQQRKERWASRSST